MILLLLACTLFAGCSSSTPERAIERQMSALLKDFQAMEPGALLRLASQATRLTEYFTPNVELEGFRGWGRIEGREALRAALVATVSAFGPVNIHSHRWTYLRISEDGRNARGELFIRGSSPREAGRVELTLTVDWQRESGDWLLHRAVVTQQGNL